MPRPLSPSEGSERLRQAFEMFDLGIGMMRQNLRRKFPRDSTRKTEERLTAWLSERPGAKYGDGQGDPVDIHDWLRRRSRLRSGRRPKS